MAQPIHALGPNRLFQKTTNFRTDDFPNHHLNVFDGNCRYTITSSSVRPTSATRAHTGYNSVERVKTRSKWRTVELLACPVTWRPHPEQIASARRGYEDWWQALDRVRDGLMAGEMLRGVEITAAMPKVQPWVRKWLWKKCPAGKASRSVRQGPHIENSPRRGTFSQPFIR